MKRIGLGMIILFLSLLLGQGVTVEATEESTPTFEPYEVDEPEEYQQNDKLLESLIKESDYQEIQEVLNEISTNPNQKTFAEYVKQLVSGEKEFNFETIINDAVQASIGEINDNKKVIVQLVIIAVIAAIFTNFSNIFQNNQVSETAFYVTYLLLFSILTSSFYVASSVAVTVLHNLLDFMKVMIPTYMLSVAFGAGASTSMVYYESTLLIISLVDILLVYVVLPAINIYFILMLANNMMKEDMLSKLTELLEMIIQWVLRTLLVVVIGINTIQGLIVPMAEHIKNSAIIKTTTAIPGIGNAINSVTETVLGAGVLVKNAVGVGGLIVIVTICLIPLVKLAFFVIIYKFGAAVVQPISDKRILGCLSASANAAKLLMTTVFIAALLFLISIALIAASTNLRA